MLGRQLPPILFILLILLAICSLPARAATFTVTNLNDSGAGSLRQAVLDANLEPTVNHVINFQPGLTGTITLTSGQISITSRVTINGPGASVLAVSGNQASRVFNVSGIPVTISGLTIKDGKPSSGGGGGINNSGALILSNLRLVGNQSTVCGGGIYNNGALTVTYSTLSHNNAQSGGGICNQKVLTVTYSTLSDNATSGNGGGIFDSSAGGETTLINSTLSGNSAAKGGGMDCFNKTVNLTNSTVTGNIAASAGGGISAGAVALVLKNTLVTGNTAVTGAEINGSYSLSSTNNRFGQNGVSGVSGATPLAAEIIPGPLSSVIGPLADNGGPTQTHAPVADSPVIDHGNNALIPEGVTTDQRGIGFARKLGGTVDIGAVEVVPAPALMTVTTTGGNGTVTSNPAGINCGETCTANFTRDISVTLTATPDTGYIFINWSGACSGASACTVTMDKAQTVTATFGQGFSLPLSSSQAGLAYPITGTLTEQLALLNTGPPLFDATTWKPIHRHHDLYDPTAAFVCSQEPNPLDKTYMSTYDFMNNVDEVTYDNCTSAFYRFTFTLPDGATPQCLNGVANADDQGVVFLNGHQISGTMYNPGCNPSPSNGPTDPCYAQQDAGKENVKDNQGRIILAWPHQDAFGTCDVTYFKAGENELVFAIAGDASYYEPTGLEFSATVTGTSSTAATHKLSVTQTGNGSGTVTSSPAGIACGADCSENYPDGSSITLTATPNPGSTFAGWSGVCTGAGACAITMNAAKSVTATFTATAPDPNPNGAMVLSGDFAGSGHAGLLWQNATTGQVYGMLMTGGNITQQGLFYTEPNTAWRITGNGDFDGDGKSDLLWWNNQTGQVYEMLMSGLSIAGGAIIYQELNTAWQIVTVGDLNGDGKADLIWWNNQTGQVYGMLMNGPAIAGGGIIYQEPNTTWRVLAARDFTGDGKADLLWRNTTTGQVYLMPMNSLSLAGGAMVYQEPNLAWSIVAVGDLNGDGKADLVWWNSQTGQVYGMLMDGPTIAQAGMMYQESNTAWRIVASGDYTGDHQADLLWRNSTTGQIYEMAMNGLSVAGGEEIHQEANADWRIVANADAPRLPAKALAGTHYAPLGGESLNPPQNLTREPVNPYYPLSGEPSTPVHPLPTD